MGNNKVNDTQEFAIWETASKEHNKLDLMYHDLELLKLKQEEELSKFEREIENQSKKVEELYQGRCKTYRDKDEF